MRTIENGHDPVEQADELNGRNRIGAAAAKGNMLHPPTPAQPLGDQRDFGAQRGQIIGQPLLAIGCSGVAPAIPANLLTIGNVDIKLQRRRGRDLIQRPRIVTRPHPLGKLHRRGIAGVARHGPGEQIGVIGPHEGVLCGEAQAVFDARQSLAVLFIVACYREFMGVYRS